MHVNVGDEIPLIRVNQEIVSRECNAAWDVFASGFTKGIFQLEKNLGQTWAKKLSPTDLEHLSALGAILRPGCLKAVSGDPPKSMTARYVDRARGNEEVKVLHESIKTALKETYQIMVYQEQAMRIAKDIAGFNLQEADVLRKAIGKKKADIMTKVHKSFIEGCEKSGIVSLDIAEEVFGWIKESQKYSFNKCLSLSTVVETEDGQKKLEEVKIGDKVKAPSSDMSSDEYVEVVDIHDNGEQDIFEFTLESGKTIQCTFDHEFLCEDGKKRKIIDILSAHHKIMCQDD